jgi:light-regulated signal transduction histidine kinase (bacteriophytochrome)
VVIDVRDALTADADRRLMRVVLENLMGNSWKFTVRVPAARIEVGSDHDGLVYFVRDNGAGFDMTYAEKLFAPFQRLHSRADFPGSGIGLATVHRIVDRHGGRVWAEATVGAGATFYFTLAPARPGSRA